MFLGEMFLPFAGLPRAEGRGFCRVDGGFEGVKDQLSGCLKRDAGEEVVNDAVQGLDPILNQVLEMNCQHFTLIQPVQIRSEAFGDVREFDVSIRPSQNADLEPRVEIGQGLIICVVDVARLHLCDVEDVRDDHIARIAENEVGDEPG